MKILESILKFYTWPPVSVFLFLMLYLMLDGLSYSTIVLYGRDDEDMGVVYEDKSSQNHLCKPFTAT